MAQHPRIYPTGAALLSLSLLLACMPASVAAATTALPSVAGKCPGEAARDIGDIDGDGVADPVVETFGPTGGGPSYLDVHNSTAPEQVIGGADVGIPAVASLGGTTLVVDVNRDGCADVVTNGNDGIYLIPGSGAGLVPSAAVRLARPEGEDDWGSSFAVMKDLRLLVVGAPGSTASPHGGGAVYLYPLTNDGTPGTAAILHQDSPGIPGNSEKGDAFGSTIAVDGKLLVIGAPGESDRKKRSGAVTLLKFTGVGLAFNAVRWTQDSSGFETRAASDEQLGDQLSVRANYIAIGVPEERFGSGYAVGIVHVVALANSQKPKVKKVYNFHQNSPGIPGKNENTDRWGSAVALAANVGCTPMSVVIGAQGDKVGKTPSGAVTVVGLGKRCASRWLPKATFGLSFRYFGREIVTLSSAAGGKAPDVVLVGDAFSRAIGDDVFETGQVVAVTTTGKGKWKAAAVPPRDGYHAFSNYGRGLGLANHG